MVFHGISWHFMAFHGISWYFTNIWEHDLNIHIIGLWKNKGYEAQHRPAGSMADFPTLRFLMVFVFSAQSKSGEVVNKGSMVLVYMLTWLGYIDGKCYIEYMDPMGLFWMFFIFKHRHGPWHGMMPNAMTWAPLFFFQKGGDQSSTTGGFEANFKLQEISQQRICEIQNWCHWSMDRSFHSRVTVVWLKRWCDVYSPILFSHVNRNSAFSVLDLCS